MDHIQEAVEDCRPSGQGLFIILQSLIKLDDGAPRPGRIGTATSPQWTLMRRESSFATHLLEDGCDIRTIQELPVHKDVRATMVCAHVLNRGGQGVRSPMDELAGQGRSAFGAPSGWA